MNPTISINGHCFVLELCDNNRTHIVEIPIGRPDKLIALLQARRTNQVRIAEPGSPTQWNIDHASAIEAFLANRRDATFAELGL